MMIAIVTTQQLRVVFEQLIALFHTVCDFLLLQNLSCVIYQYFPINSEKYSQGLCVIVGQV